MSSLNKDIINTAELISSRLSNNIGALDDIMMQVIEIGTKLKYLYDNQNDLKCQDFDRFNKNIDICEDDLITYLYALKLCLEKYMSLEPIKFFGITIGNNISINIPEDEFYDFKYILEIPKQETESYYCVERFFREINRRMKKAFVVNHVFRIKDSLNTLNIVVEI